MANLYRVDFEIVNLAPTNKSGPKYLYRSGRRQALVVANTPGGVGTVLNNDITAGTGETIEVLHVANEVSKEGLYT